MAAPSGHPAIRSAGGPCGGAACASAPKLDGARLHCPGIAREQAWVESRPPGGCRELSAGPAPRHWSNDGYLVARSGLIPSASGLLCAAMSATITCSLERRSAIATTFRPSMIIYPPNIRPIAPLCALRRSPLCPSCLAFLPSRLIAFCVVIAIERQLPTACSAPCLTAATATALQLRRRRSQNGKAAGGVRQLVAAPSKEPPSHGCDV